jgi:hypothetical protein
MVSGSGQAVRLAPRRCLVSAPMICVTRAREIPSRRAISAREATSPASSCRCHSSARVSRASGPRRSRAGAAARSRFLALTKSTTRHVAKFLFEADLGSRYESIVHYTTQGLTIIEGLEVVRRRPTMYIGAGLPEGSLCVRLVEVALEGVASDVPTPSGVRLTRWRGGVYTVAWDGEPLSVGPFAISSDSVPHPELYWYFMYMHRSDQRLGFAGAILNALSDRLVVCTMNGGERYRAVFSQGHLVTLLSKGPCAAPLGTNWLTFLPDATVVPGAASVAEVDAVTRRVAAGRSIVTFEDRANADADWG